MITKNSRERIIKPDIASSFIDIYKHHKNIKSATVTSAVPLSKEQKDSITAHFTNSSKETEGVDLTEIVNPEIIGGMLPYKSW